MKYRDAQQAASAAYHREKGTVKKPAAPKYAAPKAAAAAPAYARAKLSGALHSCAGLSEDPCEVAPNCYWQPKAQRCMTRSGKGVVGMFQAPERKAMLAAIRGQTGGRRR